MLLYINPRIFYKGISYIHNISIIWMRLNDINLTLFDQQPGHPYNFIIGLYLKIRGRGYKSMLFILYQKQNKLFSTVTLLHYIMYSINHDINSYFIYLCLCDACIAYRHTANTFNPPLL